jgi:hypothetical protein
MIQQRALQERAPLPLRVPAPLERLPWASPKTSSADWANVAMPADSKGKAAFSAAPTEKEVVHVTIGHRNVVLEAVPR